MRIIQPSVGRAIWAFFVASLVAATPALLAGIFAVYVYPFAFMIALGHALPLGAPAYFLLRSRISIGWGASMLAGALIGAAPAGLYTLVYSLFPPDNPHVRDALSSSGWLLAAAASMGLIAGTVFRWVLGPPQIETEVDASIFE